MANKNDLKTQEINLIQFIKIHYYPEKHSK